MRKQLIELLRKWCSDNTDGFPVEEVANAILKDNWIKLPFELGGEVFCIGQPCGGCPGYNEPVTEESIEKCRQCKKYEIIKCKFDWELIEDWGKLVFATEKEAEERLKELTRDVAEN